MLEYLSHTCFFLIWYMHISKILKASKQAGGRGRETMKFQSIGRSNVSSMDYGYTVRSKRVCRMRFSRPSVCDQGSLTEGSFLRFSWLVDQDTTKTDRIETARLRESQRATVLRLCFSLFLSLLRLLVRIVANSIVIAPQTTATRLFSDTLFQRVNPRELSSICCRNRCPWTTINHWIFSPFNLDILYS